MAKYIPLTLIITALIQTSAFLQPVPFNGSITINTRSTAQFMGRKTKISMSDRRKKRAKRLISPELEPVRSVEKETNKEETTDVPPPSPIVEAASPSEGAASKGAEEIGQKASSLLASQRRSVDTLTYIKKRIEENFPTDAAVESLNNKGYFVHDGFLASNSDDKDSIFGDELLSEMFEEGSDMLANEKLELDVTRLGEGEFVSLITGGEKYVDCPRLTEFVVCMTRHLPPLLNKIDTVLSNSASMGSIRMYDRKTKRGTAELLVGDDIDEDAVDRPFGVFCENDDDTRRVTAMLFLSSKSWDVSCGGGITMEAGESVGAARDRLVLLRSDSCSHRLETWKGNDEEELQQAACVTIHFVKG